jgi:hypothetical protein
VVSRTLGAGGEQERELANRYRVMSEAVKTKSPRTAALFRSLAETYSLQAKREDIDADLPDLKD